MLSQPTNFCISEKDRSPVATNSRFSSIFFLASSYVCPLPLSRRIEGPGCEGDKPYLSILDCPCHLGHGGTLGWLKREIGKARICLLLALERTRVICEGRVLDLWLIMGTQTAGTNSWQGRTKKCGSAEHQVLGCLPDGPGGTYLLETEASLCMCVQNEVHP